MPAGTASQPMSTAIEPRHVQLMQEFINPANRPKGKATQAPGIKTTPGPTMTGPAFSTMPDMMAWAMSPQGQDILRRIVAPSRATGQLIQPSS